VVGPDRSHLLVEGAVEAVEVFFLTLVLLFLLDFEGPIVLFELPFIYSVLILSILQGNLSLFFHLGHLIPVLEHEVHQTLHVDFDFDLVFFFQILLLTVLVATLGIDVFQLLLTDHPEIADPDSLIVVHKS